MNPPPIRRIRPNHTSSGHPSHIIFFDTETVTDGTRQVLQFGVAEEWVNRKHGSTAPLRMVDDLVFTTTDEFWDWVTSKCTPRRTLWVMAHNLGGFDAMVMETLGQLEGRGFEGTQVIIGTPPFVIQARRESSTIKMVDSLNYFRTSLGALGESVGIKKTEDPGGEMAERLPYCRNDVTILRTAMLKYIDLVRENDWGTFALTLAGQSMNAWRHKYYTHPVTQNHTPEVVALERAAYHGGMVLDTHRGRHLDMHCVDENSMYVHVMATKEFPVEMIAVSKRGDLEAVAAQRRRGWGHIAEVELSTKSPWYPKKGERLLFGTGNPITTLAGPELYHAIDHGHVLRMGRVQVYRMEPALSAFAKDVYRLRLEYQAAGDGAFAMMSKTLGNSLYGKFGQRTAPWIPAPEGTPHLEGPITMIDADTGERTTVRTILGRLEVRARDDQRGEASNAMCAIAAYVTSYARLGLLEGRLIAGEENAPYSDTDSIVLNSEGLRRLEAAGRIDPKRLGAWKLERSGDLVLRGPKDYVHAGNERLKGVRLNGRTTDRLAVNVWEQDQFVSMVGALNRGHRDQMHVLRVTKRISRECHKGMLHRNGKVTPPVIWNEEILTPEVCQGTFITVIEDGRCLEGCEACNYRKGYPHDYYHVKVKVVRQSPCPHCDGLTWDRLAGEIDAPWLLDASRIGAYGECDLLSGGSP